MASEDMASEGKRVVLIGVDDGVFAMHAFDFYVANVMRDNDYICLVHVPETQNFSWSSRSKVGQLLDELSTKVKALENKFTLKMIETKVQGKFRTGEGKPGEVICRIADEENAVLIVVGTRGLDAIRRTFMGSVSDYITHNAHIPVLVCKLEEQS